MGRVLGLGEGEGLSNDTRRQKEFGVASDLRCEGQQDWSTRRAMGKWESGQVRWGAGRDWRPARVKRWGRGKVRNAPERTLGATKDTVDWAAGIGVSCVLWYSMLLSMLRPMVSP